MIPVLFLTHNRLEYTKQALEALFNSSGIHVFIIDNASTDGTVEWLKQSHSWKKDSKWKVLKFNNENLGIAGAMNQYLDMIRGYNYAAKVDNDTIVPERWALQLLSDLHDNNLDIIQARHHIIPATHPEGWEGFIRNMKEIAPGIYKNHFVGGSGVLFRRRSINEIPQTDWALGGWRQFQRDHPHLKKAFSANVTIKLLDEHGYTDFPDYYKQTKRLV